MEPISIESLIEKLVEQVNGVSPLVLPVLALCIAIFAVSFIVQIVRQAYAYVLGSDEPKQKFDAEGWVRSTNRHHRDVEEFRDRMEEENEWRGM